MELRDLLIVTFLCIWSSIGLIYLILTGVYLKTFIKIMKMYEEITKVEAE